MANSKAIVAFINGNIYIDPSDVSRVDIEKIKSKILEQLGSKEVSVIVAPIYQWMPKSGTQALMNQALKDLGIPESKAYANNSLAYNNNRNIRRIAKKKKHLS
jgi:hypothetical protein